MSYKIYNHLGKLLHFTFSRSIAMKFAGYGYLVVIEDPTCTSS